MINLKNFLIAASIIAINFNISAQTDSLAINISNTPKNLTPLNKEMKGNQTLYISGAVFTYSAVAANLFSTMSEVSEPLFISSIILGSASPILIHIGQGKARNKVDELLKDFPEDHKLVKQYAYSRKLYFSGFAPMATGIVFSTFAMPTTFLHDDSTLGIAMYALAFFSLGIRDALWGKAMRNYIDIAEKVEVEDSKVSFSVSPKYDIKDKIGGLALNIHF